MAAAAAKTAKSSDLCPETFGHGRKKKGRKDGSALSSLLREQIIRSKMCKYCSREAAGKERRGEKAPLHQPTTYFRKIGLSPHFIDTGS